MGEFEPIGCNSDVTWHSCCIRGNRELRSPVGSMQHGEISQVCDHRPRNWESDQSGDHTISEQRAAEISATGVVNAATMKTAKCPLPGPEGTIDVKLPDRCDLNAAACIQGISTENNGA